MSRCNERGQRGFSLVEMVIVLAIISVVTAMALPNVLTTMNDRKVRSAELAAAGAIQSTRYKAISTGVPYMITFTSSTGLYQVQACSSCSGIYSPTSTFTYSTTDLDGSTIQPVPFSSGSSGATLASNQSIYLRPGGAVQWVADGTTSCTSPLSMTFTYGSISKTMKVECYGNITTS